MWTLKLLVPLKVLRGTPFDVFGYSDLRRREVALIAWYKGLMSDAIATGDMEHAREMAALPDQIRGYENIRRASMDRVQELAKTKCAVRNPAAPTLG